jgi:hypothetical protein
MEWNAGTVSRTVTMADSTTKVVTKMCTRKAESFIYIQLGRWKSEKKCTGRGWLLEEGEQVAPPFWVNRSEGSFIARGRKVEYFREVLRRVWSCGLFCQEASRDVAYAR